MRCGFVRIVRVLCLLVLLVLPMCAVQAAAAPNNAARAFAGYYELSNAVEDGGQLLQPRPHVQRREQVLRLLDRDLEVRSDHVREPGGFPHLHRPYLEVVGEIGHQ